MNTLNIISTVGAVVLAVTPFVGLAGAAHAQDAAFAPQAIKVSDLDFSRPADRTRFDHRVDAVATRMCPTTDLSSANACREAIRQEAAQRLAVLQGQAAPAIQLAGR